MILAALTQASASVIAASLAFSSAVAVYWAQRREAELERKRNACAEAMADAFAWLELPYRVRRRQDNDKATLNALAERFHQLHERLLFHENWMRVELPTAHPLYQMVIRAAREAAVEAIRKSWEAEPVHLPSDMNTGDLGISRTKVDATVSTFATEVKRQLRLLPWLPM